MAKSISIRESEYFALVDTIIMLEGVVESPTDEIAIERNRALINKNLSELKRLMNKYQHTGHKY